MDKKIVELVWFERVSASRHSVRCSRSFVIDGVSDTMRLMGMVSKLLDNSSNEEIYVFSHCGDYRLR